MSYTNQQWNLSADSYYHYCDKENYRNEPFKNEEIKIPEYDYKRSDDFVRDNLSNKSFKTKVWYGDERKWTFCNYK